MAGSGGAVTQIRVEDLPKLPMDQLRAVKSQVDSELEFLQESLNNLKKASMRLQNAKKAVTSISKRAEGQEVLVPLTDSLFVPGTLGATDKLIVDIGAAYYVEKSYKETEAYCDRKLALIKENQDRVAQALADKEQIVEKVMATMQAKVRSMMGGSK